MAPRYPDLHVALHTQNPFALVSAVRHGLRRNGVAREEILRFTEEALAGPDPGRVEDVCRRWADLHVLPRS